MRWAGVSWLQEGRGHASLKVWEGGSSYRGWGIHLAEWQAQRSQFPVRHQRGLWPQPLPTEPHTAVHVCCALVLSTGPVHREADTEPGKFLSSCPEMQLAKELITYRCHYHLVACLYPSTAPTQSCPLIMDRAPSQPPGCSSVSFQHLPMHENRSWESPLLLM
jgi:hypothetical protein